jgi:hypothetical protein
MESGIDGGGVAGFGHLTDLSSRALQAAARRA